MTSPTHQSPVKKKEAQPNAEGASMMPPEFSLTVNPIQCADDPNAGSDSNTDHEEHHDEIQDQENTDENAQEIIDDNSEEGFWGTEFDFEGAANDISELIRHKNSALAQSAFAKVSEKHSDEVAYFTSLLTPLEGFEACDLSFLQELRAAMEQTEHFEGWKKREMDQQKGVMDEIIANYNPLKAEFLNLMENDRLSESEISTCRNYVNSLDSDDPEQAFFFQFLLEMEFYNLFDKERLSEEEIEICKGYINSIEDAGLKTTYEAKILGYIFSNLWEKETLTTEEVALCREYIESLDDPALQESYYAILQLKAPYLNERDNGAEVYEKKGGGSCNLTSLAMSLGYLGLGVPAEVQSRLSLEGLTLVDQLRHIMKDESPSSRQTERQNGWWLPIPVVGAQVGNIVTGAKKSKDWWIDTLQGNYLSAGKAVMLSTYGHIVRVVGTSTEGLIVDDPFGMSELGKTKIKKWDANHTDNPDHAYSDNEEAASNRGEGTVWPWENVEVFKFNWIDYIQKG